jgi:hypothetical protein
MQFLLQNKTFCFKNRKEKIRERRKGRGRRFGPAVKMAHGLFSPRTESVFPFPFPRH